MKTNLTIPDIVTIGNLIAGFIGIVYLIHGQPLISIKLVVLAAILDGLDGVLARKLQEDDSSKFGAQLDSLADATSFGVLPALILYTTLNTVFAIVLAVLFLSASIIRLARFNITQTEDYFQGIPTTCAGLTLAIYTIYFDELIMTTIIVLALSILMISEIKYPKIPFKPRIAAGILLILVLITTGPFFTATTTALLALTTAYIIIFPLKNTSLKTAITKKS
ncbi:Phosphatidylserine synthase PssA [Methanonatronarchaeum thermophilum]|uniref:Phosphatidylserine synthase PssA n=1 Tax=Methanonatronarchaeum thermophilum TaxID=1927129 RepID=A0A1Y3GG17_9EURY|nr:CDP-diacylglycerol--serine O-phosphatidyltransferase [Methanonatronarchaeum thermophilum]OUJ19154.1 Phosphatidylserine synthase PssA [Methanonatronarchaeum thermophilum]